MKILQKNLTFGSALEALKGGAMIKCPEWDGYWFKRGGKIVVVLYSGDEAAGDPWLKETVFREDWQIVEKDSLTKDQIIGLGLGKDYSLDTLSSVSAAEQQTKVIGQ